MDETELEPLMTASQGDEIIEHLETIIRYLDALNVVAVSIQGYLMLTFLIVSLVGGVYVGLTFWSRR